MATVHGPMTPDEKVRENRLRRAAARQRLGLVKSRTRDPRAYDYDHWWIVDRQTRSIRAEGLTLDEVEQFLNGGQQ